MSVLRRTRALLDLDEIAEYVGRSSPPTALRFLDAFDQTVISIEPMPLLGAPSETDHPRLRGLRTWPVKGFKKYLIFYLPTPEGIEVLRVLYGTRDIETVLETEEA